jgi:hypothetical protein
MTAQQTKDRARALELSVDRARQALSGFYEQDSKHAQALRDAVALAMVVRKYTDLAQYDGDAVETSLGNVSLLRILTEAGIHKAE